MVYYMIIVSSTSQHLHFLDDKQVKNIPQTHSEGEPEHIWRLEEVDSFMKITTFIHWLHYRIDKNRI